jgi:anthranilate synthase/aminodeoxychorismate synthase-like glutamine amidotransferase
MTVQTSAGQHWGPGSSTPQCGRPATMAPAVGPRVLLIDNYDSFVYNLVQELGELGAEPLVQRNDAVGLEEIEACDPDGIVISPGPGRPESAGISLAVVGHFAGRVPILGVCLGHQCIGQHFGGRIVPAPTLMHGKTSQIHHDGQALFSGLPNPFVATRYHSLVVDPNSIPQVLEVSATTDDGVVMGLRHRSLPVEGVQFHPESVLTDSGLPMLQNFLRVVSAG